LTANRSFRIPYSLERSKGVVVGARAKGLLTLPALIEDLRRRQDWLRELSNGHRLLVL